MGEHRVHTGADDEARLNFIRHLLDDIAALEQMLQRGLIESGITRIGAEQEFCIVNENWRPMPSGPDLLKTINDPHFTSELAKYNLEINLDPIELKSDAFSKIEAQLNHLIDKGAKAANKQKSNLVLTGILPSLSMRELEIEFMTEQARYFELNRMLKKLRGADFRMHLSGVDELSIKHDSIMFEACNTSFQMHLQIDPDDFISSYNWSQVIAGPVLGLCVNSPLLLGRELWHETRVALFQQSIDTRNVSYALTDQQARVTFGESWVKGTIADVFKNEISRYRVIFSKEIEESSLKQLKKGHTPKLQALMLHNGTIYRWNRACYGVGGGKPHVRIENRYIPAGPTIIDEMANFAFWAGLMTGRPPEFDDIQEKMDFKNAKSNFIKAARHGSESIMNWMGEEIPLNQLILTKLLPIARSGLEKMNIDKKDVIRFLDIIEKRARGTTASHWMIKSYRSLKKEMKHGNALIALTKGIYDNQQSNRPVHEWSILKNQSPVNGVTGKVGNIMSTQLFTAFENDTADLTLRVMQWKNIHHLPIVDHNEKLVGLLTWNHIQRFIEKKQDGGMLPVSQIMVKSVITTKTSTDIQDAITLMKKNQIGCLPVLQKNQLVGIITIDDLQKYDHG
jgi:CBS domain-containing protein